MALKDELIDGMAMLPNFQQNVDGDDFLLFMRNGTPYKVETHWLLGQGWAQYGDATYTSGSPLTVNNARTQITLDKASGVIEQYLPRGVASLWENNKITPDQVGDAYDIRLNFKAQTSTELGGFFTFELDVGGSQGVIYASSHSFPKGQNTEAIFSITFPIYTLQTFIDNGGTMYFDTRPGSHSCTFYDISIFIKRDYKAITNV